MKTSESTAIIKNIVSRGYIFHEGIYYPPNSPLLQSLNIKTVECKPKRKRERKEPKIEPFVLYVKEKLGIDLIQEHRFHLKRRWRFDFANLEYKIAIESEGGIYTNGRHVRGKGYSNDMEKYSQCSIEGWTLIRRTPDKMMTDETLELIRQAIQLREI